MEVLTCNHCRRPTYHQTKNMLGQRINPLGNTCLTCGKINPNEQMSEISREIELTEKKLSTGG